MSINNGNQQINVSSFYTSKPVILEAVQPRMPGGRWEEVEIANQCFLINEHDPFPTWQGTLCETCGSNIYAHHELRKWTKGAKHSIDGSTPRWKILCPGDWLVANELGDIKVIPDSIFSEGYSPVTA